MKLLHITAAIAAIALAAPALAEQPKSPGASQHAPGQKMQDQGSCPRRSGRLRLQPRRSNEGSGARPRRFGRVRLQPWRSSQRQK